MSPEVTIPFDAVRYPVGSLPVVPSNGRLTVVAIKSGDEFVSLNFGDLIPGDVFLFKSAADAPIDNEMLAIRAYQTAVLADPRASSWEHSGILDSNFQLWDARTLAL